MRCNNFPAWFDERSLSRDAAMRPRQLGSSCWVLRRGPVTPLPSGSRHRAAVRGGPKVTRMTRMLKMGAVTLDGTNVHANARRHSALSYRHAEKLEKRLKEEVQRVLDLAKGSDASDEMSILEELDRRDARLAAIVELKIKARVAERQTSSIRRSSRQSRSRKGAWARGPAADHVQRRAVLRTRRSRSA